MTLERDETMLCGVPLYLVEEGDSFNPDTGWIYRNGVPVRKCFYTPRTLTNYSDFNEARIWMPRLEDVAKLEQMRWDWRQKALAKTGPRYEALINLFGPDTEAVGWKEQTGHWVAGWIKVNTHDYKNKGSVSIGYGWTEEPETVSPEDQKLVDAFLEYEVYSKKWWGRYSFVEAVFREAVSKKYWQLLYGPDKQSDTLLKITINGRDYWWKRNNSKYQTGDPVERMTYPEDTHVLEVSI